MADTYERQMNNRAELKPSELEASILALGWREDQVRWNGGFFPGFMQVQTAPAQNGKIAVWEKFIGQAP